MDIKNKATDFGKTLGAITLGAITLATLVAPEWIPMTVADVIVNKGFMVSKDIYNRIKRV